MSYRAAFALAFLVGCDTQPPISFLKNQCNQFCGGLPQVKQLVVYYQASRCECIGGSLWDTRVRHDVSEP